MNQLYPESSRGRSLIERSMSPRAPSSPLSPSPTSCPTHEAADGGHSGFNQKRPGYEAARLAALAAHDWEAPVLNTPRSPPSYDNTPFQFPSNSSSGSPSSGVGEPVFGDVARPIEGEFPIAIRYRDGGMHFSILIMSNPFVTLEGLRNQIMMAITEDMGKNISVEGLTVWWERESKSRFPPSSLVRERNFRCVLKFLMRKRSDVIEVQYQEHFYLLKGLEYGFDR
ncbi:MAG: hypothetical protein Q9184_001419 [Pyrenodesmia sp. 2 TL-2023]